jgi:two-component system sensor histidine kinase VicK
MEQPELPLIPVEEQFKVMADSAPVLIWIAGVDKLCYFFNSGWLRFTGRTMSQESGNGWAEGVHPNDLASCLEIYVTNFDARKEFKMEYRLRRNDGQYRWLVDNGVPRYLPDGTFAGYIGSCMDIDELMESDRVRTEYIKAENLREIQTLNAELENRVSERTLELLTARDRMRNFFMQAPAGICILDGPELRFELINPLYQQLFPGRDLLNKPLLKAVPEIKGEPIWEILQNVYEKGETFHGNELLIPLARTSDGPVEDRYFDFIYQARLDESSRPNGIMVFVTEVTEHVKARKDTERAKESLRMAIDAADLGAYYIDTSDRAFHPSPRFKEFFGFGPEEELPFESAIGQIQEDYRQPVNDLVEAAITKGLRFDMEYPVRGHNDGKLRWVRGIGEVQHDTDGKSYFTGVLHEITERKQDEMRKNDFIGMVSHELKTPLTSLTSYLQVLQSKATQSSDSFTRGALDQSVKQVKKMTTMINSFLNISRLESGKIHIDRQTFDMASLVKETEAETVVMNNSHTFIFHPVERTMVNADRDKIGQVISNFISNAVKYSKPGSTIQIACVSEGNEARFSVSDEGMGISVEDTGRLFERYYRVKNNSSISGFGIGLYLCSEIVMRHEGKIWVESEPGKGSVFYFSLMLEK